MPGEERDDPVAHLLGELEVAIMRLMWAHETATVREIQTLLRANGRELAYTTVMTVMGRLVTKGLLTRTLAGKTHSYHAALDEPAFLRMAAAQRVQALIDDLGDVALAQFLATVGELSPERRRQLADMAGKITS